VPALLGFVRAVAVVLGAGPIASDSRRRHRVVRHHPSTASTTIADEVEKWLRDQG
jgi:hypothetical protein